MTTPVDNRLSLIMTVWNEADGLHEFLGTLSQMTLMPGEIVVVDGGSTDQTVRILRDWEPPPGVDVRVHEAPGANISRGRNLAVLDARREWIAVTDAGTTIDSQWLAQIAAQIDDSVDIVSGWFEPLQSTPVATTIASVITPLRSEIDPAGFLPSSRSIAFRKTIWQGAGGYPEWLDYCEDLVFDLAMKSRGARFKFTDAAVVRWAGRPSLAAFYRQYYRYARGDGKAGLWPKRHAVRYATYAGALGLSGLALRSPIFAVPIAIGFVVYMSKFWIRSARHPGVSKPARLIRILLTPTVVVTGDVAKMLGYPVGVIWRRRNRRVNPTGR